MNPTRNIAILIACVIAFIGWLVFRNPGPAPSSAGNVNSQSKSRGAVGQENPTGPGADPTSRSRNAPFDYLAAMDAQIGSTNPLMDGNDLMVLMREWASSHPQAALAWAQKVSDANLSNQLIESGVLAWSELDFDAALVWARGLENTNQVQKLTLVLAMEAVRFNPVQSIELLRGMELHPESQTVLIRALSEVATTDSEIALEYARDLKDPVLRGEVISAIALAMSDREHMEAANLILKEVDDPNEKQRAILSVVQRWVQSEPDKVAKWVERFPEGEFQKNTVEAMIPIWSQKDPKAVGQWIADLPGGTLRNNALASYAGYLKIENPSLAQGWLNSIRDPAMHQSAKEKLDSP